MAKFITLIRSSLVVLLVTSCGLLPKKTSFNNPQVQQLLQAASAFDRVTYGFTSIKSLPTTTDVRLESAVRKKYDVMLHVYSKTSHTIAFQKATNDNYRWIAEQEIFNGPKKYPTPDGLSQEHICLDYQIEKVEGLPKNRLIITYYGVDPRLTIKSNALTLPYIRSILKEWNY